MEYSFWHKERTDMIKRDCFKTEISDREINDKQHHQEIVMLFVLEGNLKVSVEHKISQLHMEDMLVINVDHHYSIQAGNSTLYMILYIDYMLVSEMLEASDILLWCDSSLSKSKRYDALRSIIWKFLKHYIETDQNKKNFGYLSDCFEILNQLTANFRIKTSEADVIEEKERYDVRIQKINQYIYLNYDQAISMKELAEKLYLSNGYLSRFFKKNYGMSFANYLTNVRMYHAAEDLQYTDSPITRIAYNNGFTSSALFNKQFKKSYGMTPSEFRKNGISEQKSEEEREHQKELDKRVENVIVMQGEEEKEFLEAKNMESIFEVKEHHAINNFWGEVINVGQASLLQQSVMREHLLLLQKALHFKYVRCWNFFSKELFITPEIKDHFNFTMLDSILDYILDLGLKPYIELGMKPNQIHYEIGDSKLKDAQAELMDFFSLEQWTHLLTAWMKHLSNRYGRENIKDWKMELWYDEEWRKNPEKNNKRYLKMFSETYKIIKACHEKIQVGGYSIRMDAEASSREHFLKQWQEEECRPDFISVMYYGYEYGGSDFKQYIKRTTDNDAMYHLISKEKKLIADAGMKNVPLYVNEWNFTPSVRNYMNDTTFKGAYIVKNIIDLYGQVDVMGYGAGSDREYAFFDTSDIIFGGNGLITKDGILKPAAFAFEFFNRLLPYYLGKARNYLVTTDLEDNYGIICHNQQVLNYNYYLTRETELKKEGMWRYYERLDKLKIKIRIQGVRDGNYQVKIYRINELNGSIMHIWEELNYERELSRNDIKYFRRVCEPNMSNKRVEARNSSMLIEEQLLPNEIAFIAVRKENE